MHGGVKMYRGTAAAARNHVEADRSRADDNYLAEGTGIASRFTTGRDGRVIERASLSGDGYEGWVAGLDPDSGDPRVRLRPDAHGVRFIEVAVQRNPSRTVPRFRREQTIEFKEVPSVLVDDERAKRLRQKRRQQGRRPRLPVHTADPPVTFAADDQQAPAPGQGSSQLVD
jgi:hypothetical protein